MTRWPGDARRERTTFGGLSRGELMSRVRSRGNITTEKRFASLLRAAKLSGWRRHRSMVGRPDFVWHLARVAVFVDGCFWHGHRCGTKNFAPATNAQAWQEKIARNVSRDRRNTKLLRQQGWIVLRIWECQLVKNPGKCVAKVRKAVCSKSQ
jgi:DNA mismatch endonuclease (patch repair protein)